MKGESNSSQALQQKARFGFQTLVEMLRRRAEEQPDFIGWIYLEDGETETSRLSYRLLYERACAVAAALQERGVKPGDRALLTYRPGLDFVCGFFGCLLAGVIAVPAYPPTRSRSNRGLSRLLNIIADARPAAMLSTADVAPLAQNIFRRHHDLGGLEWLATDDLNMAAAAAWQPPQIKDESLAFLQYTSGSTGTPRGVMLKHSNLLHNAWMIYESFKENEKDVYLSWLPIFHDMGFMAGVLQPLYANLLVVLMPPGAFLQRPLRWLTAISKYRATISGGPNFAFDLCARRATPEERAQLDLSGWRIAFSGAEPVRAETLERFAKTFAESGFRQEALYPCYGLAEATLIVSGGDPGASPVVHTLDAAALHNNQIIDAPADAENAKAVVGCGRVLMDQKVVIANPESLTMCMANEVGEIWVAGQSVAEGYWGRPGESAEIFKAHLADTGEGPFLRTGDAGASLNGQLLIAGRLKDLIIIRGLNHYPQDIELTVEKCHPALRTGGNAAFTIEVDGEERLVIVQEVGAKAQLNYEEIFTEIRKEVSLEHELQVYGIALIEPGTSLKTSSGKIQRRATRGAYLEGGLKTVAEWRSPLAREGDHGVGEQSLEAARRPILDLTAIRSLLTSQTAAIQNWIVTELANVLGVGPGEIDVTQPVVRYGLDSLAAIDLMHGLESKLGFSLPASSFLQEASIVELAAEAIKQLANNAVIPIATSQVSEEVEYPLSYGQRGLLFLQQLAPESAAYNIVRAIRFGSTLNVAALRRAFRTLVQRHPALRATFSDGDGQPMQRIANEVAGYWEEFDAAAWSEDDLRARLLAESTRPFDLLQGPLFRISLFSRTADETVALVAAHHIIVDFWSLTVLLRELGDFYAAETESKTSEAPILTAQYADFVKWQAEMLAGPEGWRLKSYWEKQLSGALPTLDLPMARSRPPAKTFHGSSYPFKLDAGLTTRLRELSRGEGATLYVTLLAAFQTLLYRYTGQRDILVGCPVMGRKRAEWRRLIGYFVNTVVLRTQFSGALNFRELMSQVRRTFLEALDHQDYPFSLLVESLQPERDLSRSPLFQTMFVMQKGQGEGGEKLSLLALGEAGARLELGGLELESVALERRVAQFDLTLMVAEAGDSLAATLEFNADLFERDAIRRLAGSFCALLEAIVESPGDRLANFPLLTATEAEQIVVSWNDTRRDFGSELRISRLIEAQVERTPEATALVFDGEHISYRHLNEVASRLARYLCSLGVGPEARVGICVERSLEMVIGLLAILKAGGAYVPLDPQHPQERLAFMLEDARVKVLLTQKRLSEALPKDHSAQVVCLDGDWELLAHASAGKLENIVTAGNLAYVLYTSGSTGLPKGTMIEHRSVVNYLCWVNQELLNEAGRNIPASASLTFDASLKQLLAPLLRGDKVWLLSSAVVTEPAELLKEINTRDNVVFNCVPSLWAAILDEIQSQRAVGLTTNLRSLLIGGEQFSAELVKKSFAHAPHLKIWNLYGPTEATANASVARVVPEKEISIGRPIANTQLYVLDGNMNPTPVGASGELYIGGEGLARGYIERPDLTAERFIPHPFSKDPGARLYRTGDLAHYLPDGNLEFLGRLDNQVKLRGYRIELGEIEAALREHPRIREAVVLARQNSTEEKRLVAYLVPEREPAPTASEARAFLKERLPEYMTPSAFVLLDELPLTPNGKVDRRALPAPDQARLDVEAAYVAPRMPTEEMVAAIWSQVLGVERVGVHDNFFELGGHSLLATQVISRVRGAFQVEAPLRILFEGPTVAELAQRVEAELRAGTGLRTPAIRRVLWERGIPLSFAQQRLWFLDQMEPGNPFYNVPGAVRMRGGLDVEALRASINNVVARHESLRTRFAVTDGEPAQVIEPEIEIELAETDLRGMSVERREAELERLARAEAMAPFDLSRAPLLRARLARLAEEEHALLVVMHHIVSDGWSVGVFVKELAEFYSAAARGGRAELAELPVQYADYAVWQRETMAGERYEEQARYWRERLEGTAERLELPTDRPRPPVQSHRGARLKLQLQPELSEKIKALSQKEGVTLFMTLLAGFKALLHHYTGQDDIVVGSDIANRTRVETEGLIGFLSNMIVLRTDLSADPTFRELLGRVKEVTLGAYAHQDLTFEKLVEELKPKRELSYAPLFQVVFTLQNAPRQKFKFEGLELDIHGIDSGTAKFDIVTNLWDTGEALTGVVEYSTDLFDAATIDRLLRHFEATLQAAVQHPERRMSELSPLSEAQRHEVLVEWNQSQQPYPSQSCIHELIEDQVSRAPDAPAVSCEGEVVSYAEVNARANRLAHHLARRGVGPGMRVGIYLRHSPEVVISLLAVLKAGAAYVPLEPAHPSARSAFILADAELGLIITQTHLAESLSQSAARVLPSAARVLPSAARVLPSAGAFC